MDQLSVVRAADQAAAWIAAIRQYASDMAPGSGCPRLRSPWGRARPSLGSSPAVAGAGDVVGHRHDAHVDALTPPPRSTAEPTRTTWPADGEAKMLPHTAPAAIPAPTRPAKAG